jgi:hypothetical protein
MMSSFGRQIWKAIVPLQSRRHYGVTSSPSGRLRFDQTGSYLAARWSCLAHSIPAAFPAAKLTSPAVLRPSDVSF